MSNVGNKKKKQSAECMVSQRPIIHNLARATSIPSSPPSTCPLPLSPFFSWDFLYCLSFLTRILPLSSIHEPTAEIGLNVRPILFLMVHGLFPLMFLKWKTPHQKQERWFNPFWEKRDGCFCFMRVRNKHRHRYLGLRFHFLGFRSPSFPCSMDMDGQKKKITQTNKSIGHETTLFLGYGSVCVCVCVSIRSCVWLLAYGGEERGEDTTVPVREYFFIHTVCMKAGRRGISVFRNIPLGGVFHTNHSKYFFDICLSFLSAKGVIGQETRR